jgi:DNA-binding HxlR family transcriptional regulator
VASYGQYCALAKALEIVGDRWTLLIVRELMGRGPLRYTDLRDGLPGIATNLLAKRLRELADAGVIVKERPAPPVATPLFRLTERGEALRPVLRELGRWGAPFLVDAPESDRFCAQWFALPVDLFLRDATPQQPPATLQLEAGDEPVAIEIGGKIRTRPGRVEHPDAILRGPLRSVIAVVLHQLPLDAAAAHGVRLEGDRRTLARLETVADPA